jgi:hypothetical protein
VTAIWLANVLLALLAGFMMYDWLSKEGLKLVVQRVVYDEPRAVVVGIQLRSGAAA